jgi:SAM-dependent methyltransferase
MDATYAASYAALYRGHWWWRARERMLLQEVERVAGGRRLRVLDAGCGAGLFFDALQRFGDVEGVEADQRLVAQAGRWRDRIVVGSLDDGFTPSRPYDLVLLLDVLEHLADPEGALRRARAIATPEATLIVTVPALRALWTSHDTLNAHRRRYRRGELRDALARTGWHAVTLQYLFASLVVPKLLVRCVEAISRPTPAAPRIPPAPVNRLLETICSVDLAMRGVWPVGSSLLAVARPADPR